MKYFKIFLLYCQQVAEQRARVFVWFLLSLFGPLVLILFWRGARINGGITFSEITTYYLLFIIAGALLMTHPEGDVARLDIQEGALVSYILKPFSYYWSRFFSEIPWRIFQGFFGLITLFFFVYFLRVHIVFTHALFFLLAGIVSCCFAIMLSFSYKMSLGILAFWFTDMGGLFQFSDMLALIFAGYIIPVYLYPNWLQTLSYSTPFAYMLYFPIAVLQGKLSVQQVLFFLIVQLGWIGFFYFTYHILWLAGLRKFSGVGQ